MRADASLFFSLSCFFIFFPYDASLCSVLNIQAHQQPIVLYIEILNSILHYHPSQNNKEPSPCNEYKSHDIIGIRGRGRKDDKEKGCMEKKLR